MAQEEQNDHTTERHPFALYIAAPSVRKIAREKNIDLALIKGSGRNGRILHADLKQEKKMGKHMEKVIPIHASMTDIRGPYQEIPFRGIRKKIAERMVHAVQTIPHHTHFDELDLTEMMALRKEWKATGTSISVVVFFLKALAVSLQDFPVFNAIWNEETKEMERYSDINIGIATDTPNGLIVPVLKQMDQKPFTTIQTEMKALTKQAQEGKLALTDLQKGTFSISNVGPLGGMKATPIINHPQTGIMAFHKTKRVPVYVEAGKYDIRTMMNLSFSFDTRVADIGEATRFTQYFISLLEEPKKLMLHL